ncbi:MAG: hypothetical protein ACJ77M_08885 [Thermoleophilaceae bacterium]
MTFLRLTRWNWIAFIAALALLFTMSTIWWTSAQAQECRRGERLQTPPAVLRGPQSDQFGRDVRQSARDCAAKAERNAWQADGAADRILLAFLLVTVGAAVVAAFLRATGRRVHPPRTPSAIASVAGLTAALLLLYRILQPPGPNAGAVVEGTAYIGFILVAVVAFASRIAALREREPQVASADGADSSASSDGASKEGASAAPKQRRARPASGW